MAKFKKIIVYLVLIVTISISLYFAYIYYVPYSDGVRSGELIKINHKGYLVKTWEGEISQGLSGTQIFSFSVMDNNPEVIKKLKALQGQYVKIEYVERYKTFFWWGDSNYFITNIYPEKLPRFNK